MVLAADTMCSVLQKCQPSPMLVGTNGNRQFNLGQNFPNPFKYQTTVPFYLLQAADVVLEIWNMAGNKVMSITRIAMEAGSQFIDLDLKFLGLNNENYIYKLQVTNAEGIFSQAGMMDASR